MKTTKQTNPQPDILLRDGQADQDGLIMRLAPMPTSSGTPTSFNREARSVDVLALTEEPVNSYDPSTGGTVRDVVRLDGIEYPDRVPLLDVHSRWSTESQLGSARVLNVANGEMNMRAVFSTVDAGERAMTLLAEGHLDSFSAAYSPLESEFVPAGQTRTIKGRSYTGPILVHTRSRLVELSITPVGADPRAKARTAPTTSTKPNTEGTSPMDPKLKELLVRLGLASDATDEVATAFMRTAIADGRLTAAQVADPTAPASGTPAAPTAPAAPAAPAAPQAPTQRTASPGAPAAPAPAAPVAPPAYGDAPQILSMCQRLGCPEIGTKAVQDGITLERASQLVTNHLMQQAQSQPMPAAGVQIIGEERDKFRAAAEHGLYLRTGLELGEGVTIAPGAHELAGYTLRELARESLHRAGHREGGSMEEVIARAFTTSDFPLILANVANKALFMGFETAEETWPVWCDIGSVSDFKTHSSVRASEMDDFDELGENDEYKYTARSESQEQYAIATYGKMLAISRQTVINDDLNALNDRPRAMGEAASRKLGDIAYTVLTGNAAMGDTIALFDASSHLNYVASGTAPDVSSIGAGYTAMKKQKDLANKRRLNIRPQYFVAPVALETTSEVFFSSQMIGTEAQPNQVNIFGGNRLVRVYEPRLDDDSATAWYLAGGKGKTVKMFFLNGQRTPYMDTKDGWHRDGVEMKARIDAGAKAMDWRALYKNSGTGG